jgi:hypothetical protein
MIVDKAFRLMPSIAASCVLTFTVSSIADPTSQGLGLHIRACESGKARTLRLYAVLSESMKIELLEPSELFG